MIRRKPLIATAIIASAVIIACSDMTASKNHPGGLPAAAILAPHAGPATVVATINGGGTAEMGPPGFAMGVSSWGTGVTLLSDGSATGHFDCVDQHADQLTGPGNIFGEATSWSKEGDVIVLNFIGKNINFPGGHPTDQAFTVKIQRFGGAGVGHWSLQDPTGFIFCWELLTSGQIVYRPA